MKIIVAMMEHETNTFSPIPTRLRDFGPGGPLTGQAAYDAFRTSGYSIAGLLEVAEEVGTVEVPVAASAPPGAAVENDAFEAIAGAICDAVSRGCDALFLDLHGAMVTKAHDDAEGELLARLRRLAPDLPIAVALDLHANVTRRIVENCTTLVGYKTYPHIDMVEAGRRSGRMLLDAMQGRIAPVIVHQRCPILPNMLRMATEESPMRELIAAARAAESDGALAVSVFGGFPLADIPEPGLSVVAMTDGRREAAEDICRRIVRLAWESRDGFKSDFEPLSQSVARAKAFADGPVVLVDHADNCNSGGTQDTMTVIAEMLRQGLTDIAAGPICDPEAVQAMVDAGIGAEVTLPIGGKVPFDTGGEPSKPLRLTGRVKTISLGDFVVRGPVFTGTQVDLGRTAVLDTGDLELVVSEQRTEPLDLAMFRRFGVDPVHKRFVVVKSKIQYRPTFGAMAKHVVECNGSGASSMDFARFPFRKVTRPVWPLDRNADFGG